MYKGCSLLATPRTDPDEPDSGRCASAAAGLDQPASTDDRHLRPLHFLHAAKVAGKRRSSGSTSMTQRIASTPSASMYH